MTKRFIVESVMIDCLCEDEPRIAKVITDTDENYSYEDLYEVAELLNEQQATIRKLQDLCGESDGENAKLRIENKKLKAKLKEKEEDEQLYANEIVELRKTYEEWLQFKDLGGDY